MLEVRIGTARDVFERLRRGRVLVVRAARQDLSFRLTDTGRALREPVDCVELARAFASRETDPLAARSPSPGTPSAETPQNPFATGPAPARGRSGDNQPQSWRCSRRPGWPRRA